MRVTWLQGVLKRFANTSRTWSMIEVKGVFHTMHSRCGGFVHGWSSWTSTSLTCLFFFSGLVVAVDADDLYDARDTHFFCSERCREGGWRRELLRVVFLESQFHDDEIQKEHLDSDWRDGLVHVCVCVCVCV